MKETGMVLFCLRGVNYGFWHPLRPIYMVQFLLTIVAYDFYSEHCSRPGGVDATIVKHYFVTYSRWRRNGVRSRNFGAKQNDFSELLVNLFQLNIWFLEFASLSLYISFLFVTKSSILSVSI